MDALALLEVMLLDEALAAGRAAVGALPSVDAVVLVEVGLLVEALPAGRALEGTLARVQALVPQQRGVVGRALPARRADEGAVALPRLALLRRQEVVLQPDALPSQRERTGLFPRGAGTMLLRAGLRRDGLRGGVFSQQHSLGQGEGLVSPHTEHMLHWEERAGAG